MLFICNVKDAAVVVAIKSLMLLNNFSSFTISILYHHDVGYTHWFNLAIGTSDVFFQNFLMTTRMHRILMLFPKVYCIYSFPFAENISLLNDVIEWTWNLTLVRIMKTSFLWVLFYLSSFLMFCYKLWKYWCSLMFTDILG